MTPTEFLNTILAGKTIAKVVPPGAHSGYKSQAPAIAEIHFTDGSYIYLWGAGDGEHCITTGLEKPDGGLVWFYDGKMMDHSPPREPGSPT